MEQMVRMLRRVKLDPVHDQHGIGGPDGRAQVAAQSHVAGLAEAEDECLGRRLGVRAAQICSWRPTSTTPGLAQKRARRAPVIPWRPSRYHACSAYPHSSNTDFRSNAVTRSSSVMAIMACHVSSETTIVWVGAPSGGGQSSWTGVAQPNRKIARPGMAQVACFLTSAMAVMNKSPATIIALISCQPAYLLADLAMTRGRRSDLTYCI